MNILNEYGKTRNAWDAIVLLAIILSALVIPYEVAFNYSGLQTFSLLIYLLDFVLLVDVYLNFHTSYRFQGIEVFDKKLISKKYLKTFFWIDLIAALPLDLLFLNSGIIIWGVDVIVYFRLLRILRIIRLFRLFSKWQNGGVFNPGTVRIVKFLSVIFLLTHLLACIWYFTSFISGFPIDCWVTVAGIADGNDFTKYIRSLYWTTTTMTTIGYGDITPLRNVEYVFVIIVMFIGASTYAFIIGTVASLLNNLNSIKTEHWNNVESTGLYLKQRNVPKQLIDKVKNYYDYMWGAQAGMEQKSLFNTLPKTLKLELLLELTKESFKNIPLFKYSSTSLKNELLDSLELRIYTPGDSIMHIGDTPTSIYFISKGEVSVGKDNTVFTNLHKGEYFGDVSLILGESISGNVKTDTYCEIYTLSKEKYLSLKSTYPEFIEVMKKMSSEKPAKIIQLIAEGIVL